MTDHNGGSSRYTSTCNLHNVYSEEKGSAWTVRRCGALTWLLRWLSSLMALEGPFKHLMYTPRNGGRAVLTGKHCQGQCGHKNFRLAKNIRPGCFVIISVAEGSTVYVFVRFYRNFFFKKKLGRYLRRPVAGRDGYFLKFCIYHHGCMAPTDIR